MLKTNMTVRGIVYKGCRRLREWRTKQKEGKMENETEADSSHGFVAIVGDTGQAIKISSQMVVCTRNEVPVWLTFRR